jgi:hypothetical protein
MKKPPFALAASLVEAWCRAYLLQARVQKKKPKDLTHAHRCSWIRLTPLNALLKQLSSPQRPQSKKAHTFQQNVDRSLRLIVERSQETPPERLLQEVIDHPFKEHLLAKHKLSKTPRASTQQSNPLRASIFSSQAIAKETPPEWLLFRDEERLFQGVIKAPTSI